MRQLVMHGLAVKKLAPAKGVADLLGVDEADVAAELDALVKDGKAIAARGAFMLKPEAQAELKEGYAAAHADLRADAALAEAYERFEAVNRDLKALVTDWQTLTVAGESIPNDHSDAEHDARCVDRLGSLHERAEPVLRALAARLARLAAYEKRLAHALEKIEDGDTTWFSGAKIDSYHTVWFELHEDLLRLLGRTRDE